VDADKRHRYRQRPNEGWPRIEFAHTATRHRISRDRSFWIVDRSQKGWEIETRDGRFRIAFARDDSNGAPLEVIGAETESNRFMVIHAMPLRPKFKWLYEETK
jgi:hypothetical protein